MLAGSMILALVCTIGPTRRFFAVSDAESIKHAHGRDPDSLIVGLGSGAVLTTPGENYWGENSFDFSGGISDIQMLRELGFEFFEIRFDGYAPRNSDQDTFRITPDFGWDEILPGDNPPWDGVDPDLYDTLAKLAMDEVLNLPPRDRGKSWLGWPSVWPILPGKWADMMEAALRDFIPNIGLGEGDSVVITVVNEPDHFRWRMQEIYFLVYWDNEHVGKDTLLYDTTVIYNGIHWVKVIKQAELKDPEHITATLKFQFWLNTDPLHQEKPDYEKVITIMPRMHDPVQDVNITRSKAFRDSVLYYWWAPEDYVNRALKPCYEVVKSNTLWRDKVKVAGPSWAFDLWWCHEDGNTQFPGHPLEQVYGAFNPEGPHKWPSNAGYFPGTFSYFTTDVSGDSIYPGLVQAMEGHDWKDNLGGHERTGHAKGFFEAGGQDYCDIITYHMYPGWELVDTVNGGALAWEKPFPYGSRSVEPFDTIGYFLSVLHGIHKKFGVDKLVYFDEYGIYAYTGVGNSPESAMPRGEVDPVYRSAQDTQAVYVVHYTDLLTTWAKEELSNFNITQIDLHTYATQHGTGWDMVRQRFQVGDYDDPRPLYYAYQNYIQTYEQPHLASRRADATFGGGMKMFAQQGQVGLFFPYEEYSLELASPNNYPLDTTRGIRFVITDNEGNLLPDVPTSMVDIVGDFVEPTTAVASQYSPPVFSAYLSADRQKIFLSQLDFEGGPVNTVSLPVPPGQGLLRSPVLVARGRMLHLIIERQTSNNNVLYYAEFSPDDFHSISWEEVALYTPASFPPPDGQPYITSVPRMVLTRQGRPVVAFENRGRIYTARKSLGRWIKIQRSPVGKMCVHPDLVLDPNGRVSMAWINTTVDSVQAFKVFMSIPWGARRWNVGDVDPEAINSFPSISHFGSDMFVVWPDLCRVNDLNPPTYSLRVAQGKRRSGLLFQYDWFSSGKSISGVDQMFPMLKPITDDVLQLSWTQGKYDIYRVATRPLDLTPSVAFTAPSSNSIFQVGDVLTLRWDYKQVIESDIETQTLDWHWSKQASWTGIPLNPGDRSCEFIVPSLPYDVVDGYDTLLVFRIRGMDKLGRECEDQLELQAWWMIGNTAYNTDKHLQKNGEWFASYKRSLITDRCEESDKKISVYVAQSNDLIEWDPEGLPETGGYVSYPTILLRYDNSPVVFYCFAGGLNEAKMGYSVYDGNMWSSESITLSNGLKSITQLAPFLKGDSAHAVMAGSDGNGFAVYYIPRFSTSDPPSDISPIPIAIVSSDHNPMPRVIVDDFGGGAGYDSIHVFFVDRDGTVVYYTALDNDQGNIHFEPPNPSLAMRPFSTLILTVMCFKWPIRRRIQRYGSWRESCPVGAGQRPFRWCHRIPIAPVFSIIRVSWAMRWPLLPKR